MWGKLPIISVKTAKFDSPIRFSAENLLNSGCHFYKQFGCAIKYFLVPNVLKAYRLQGQFMTTGIPAQLRGQV